jgi:hypothetical protein
MLISPHHNAGQDHNLKTVNKSFGNAKYKHLKVTDQNCIHEELKSRLTSGNTCYCSVQNILPSLAQFLLKIKICKSIALRVEYSLRVSENRVLRRIFGIKRNEVTSIWRKMHNEELLTKCQNDEIKDYDVGEACRQHGEKRNAYTNLVKKTEDLKVDGWVSLTWILRKWDGSVWTG